MAPWRLLPREYGPWSTVYGYFLWVLSHLALGRDVGAGARHTARAPATAGQAPADPQRRDHGSPVGQSVKTTARGAPHGDEDPGAKKLSGRKRHLLVDTLGLVLRVVVPPADLQDRAGAPQLLLPLAAALPRLELIWADSGQRLPGAAADLGAADLGAADLGLAPADRGAARRTRLVAAGGLGAAHSATRLPGFQLLPRRWIVERTIAWIGRNRRMSKDDEFLPATSEAWVYLSMQRVMLKRLAHEQIQPALHYRRVA